jgi:gamma-glutamyltranspeptidase / glutathione hydrolase
MAAMGGNAIDATIAALFTLSVVEPMMVGIFGGGTSLIRLSDGEEVVIDGLSTAPSAARPDSYTPLSDSWPLYMEVEERRNRAGASSVAVPGNLLAWAQTLERYGRLTLAQAMEPAIRHARRGFRVTGYFIACLTEAQEDIARDPEAAALLMPHGRLLHVGDLLIQSDYAGTLERIRDDGVQTLYGGALGREIAEKLTAAGSFLRLEDLAAYRTIDRDPVRGCYRGFEIVGPPAPCSGGLHCIQMLNLMEGFDVAGMGFGTIEGIHLLLEVMKIAATDRLAATADPEFVKVPTNRLLSKGYADLRRPEIDMSRASSYQPRVVGNDSSNTTHLTVADGDGNIVSSTQTINSLFGARMIVPGTGIFPNNYMYLFDPHPGGALSLQPGKRITSTQSPLIGYRDGRPAFALGLPGGPRLYASAFQAVVNLIDHGMSLQEAVEAPRVWTMGQDVELEDRISAETGRALAEMGHDVRIVGHVAGGMSAAGFNGDGSITGASCWRADGTPLGVGGGLARQNVSFWADAYSSTK